MPAGLLENSYDCNRAGKSLLKCHTRPAALTENPNSLNKKAVLWKMLFSSPSPCFPPAPISSGSHVLRHANNAQLQAQLPCFVASHGKHLNLLCALLPFRRAELQQRFVLV